MTGESGIIGKPRTLLVRVAVVVGIVGLALAFYFFVVLPSQRSSNERDASSALKMLSSANADFRANDRDRNQVNDFWAGDVAGLYYVKTGQKGTDQEIRLISSGIAEADTAPLKPQVPHPIPYKGYFFVALQGDDEVKGTEEEFYKRDTGGNREMGRVHNLAKFGFCAFPEKYGVTGRHTFIVNENNTIFRTDNGGKPLKRWPKIEGPALYHACPESGH